MPTRALSHSQNMAPGPPVAMARATPTMLPVPTVAARAVHTAWNGEISPSCCWDLSFFWNRVLVV